MSNEFRFGVLCNRVMSSLNTAGCDGMEDGCFGGVVGQSFGSRALQLVTIQRASFPLILFFQPPLPPLHWPALSLPFFLF